MHPNHGCGQTRYDSTRSRSVGAQGAFPPVRTCCEDSADLFVTACEVTKVQPTDISFGQLIANSPSPSRHRLSWFGGRSNVAELGSHMLQGWDPTPIETGSV